MDERAFEQRVLELEPRLYRTACAILWNDADAADALQECGIRHFTFTDVFHGKLFKDNQVSKVFCLWLDRDAESFTVQKEEIDYVRWFGLEEAIEAVKNNTIPNCIYLEELEMVAAAVFQRVSPPCGDTLL